MNRGQLATTILIVIAAGGAAVAISGCSSDKSSLQTQQAKQHHGQQNGQQRPTTISPLSIENKKTAIKIAKKTSFTQAKPIALSGSSISTKTSTRTKLKKPKTKKKNKRISAFAKVMQLVSLHNNSDDNKVNVTTGSLGIGYKLKNDLKVQAVWPFLGNLIASAKKDYELSDRLHVMPAMAITLPTNSVDRDTNTYQGSASIAGGIDYEIKSPTTPITISYILGAEKALHKYTRSAAGTANVSHGISHELDISTELTSKLSFGVAGSYGLGWTYQNSRRNTFNISETINYQATKKLSMAIGHSNGGDVLAADGKDRNVEFYDKNRSAVFGSLRVKY